MLPTQGLTSQHPPLPSEDQLLPRRLIIIISFAPVLTAKTYQMLTAP